ncbi:protein ZW2-like [Typha angustifolia]|uniref:protein ZW2-like n=1 Tax=Typha angustifolia TaxID=59011 RepID=UPI003C2B6693
MTMDSFFEEWIARSREILDSLLSAPRDRPDLLLPLISTAVSHHRHYRRRKSHIAGGDLLLALDHPWLTPFERTFLWLSGWKPSLVFRFLSGDLTAEQRLAVAELRREAAAEERGLTAAMTTVQENLASPTVMAAVQRADKREEVAEAVAGPLRGIMESADEVRARILKRIVEILAPRQAVEFLAAAMGFHLEVRLLGTQWNSGRRTG